MSTYSMIYVCTNCGTRFNKVLSKGTFARGSGGECPNCGVIDGGKFQFVPETEYSKGLQSKKQDILLEGKYDKR